MSEGIYLPCAPFLYLVSDSAGRRRPGMEVTSRSPGPFRYLVSEQAKSLVALHELQHEVGALLEFRDLVMETFPHLRDKMASPSASSALLPGDEASPRLPPDHRREWEPGVRVRRKLSPKGVKGKQPKSGETLSTGSAVQDSGFSTETSSKEQSKEGCVVPPATTALAASSPGQHERDEAEDELWNLLDVIQRKGSKLRDEVEVLQEKLQDMKEGGESGEGGEGMASLGPLEDALPRAFKTGGSMRGNSSYPDKIYPDDQLREVKFERDYLMDKMSEMEAETLAARVRAEQLTCDVAQLAAAKRHLEEQLRTAVLQKGELNSRIHELHTRFVGAAAAIPKRSPAASSSTPSSSAFAPVPLRSAKQSPALAPSIEQSLALAPSIQQSPSFAPSIQQSPALAPSIEQSPRLARSTEQSPTFARSIEQSPPRLMQQLPSVSVEQSPAPSVKQALTRSNTFEVSRSPKPSAPAKQSPTRSDTFSVPAKQSPVRPTAIAGSIRQSPVRREPAKQSPVGESMLQPSSEPVGQPPTRSIRQPATVSPRESPTLKQAEPMRPSPGVPWKRRGGAPSTKAVRLRVRLGALDGVVSCPATLLPGPRPDRDKMAAVLRETSRVELQRHLLVTCVENQRLSARLDEQDAQLRSRIAQLVDSNDELSFRLAEREIELESARAQIRILDRGADSSLPTSRPRRPSKIPKSSAPKPPAPSPCPGNQGPGNQGPGNHTAKTPGYERTTPNVYRAASKSSLPERSNSNVSLTDRNVSTHNSANRNALKIAFADRNNSNGSLTDRSVTTPYSASRTLSKSSLTERSNSNVSLTDRNVSASNGVNRNASKSAFADRNNSNGSLTDRSVTTPHVPGRNLSKSAFADRSNSEGSPPDPTVPSPSLATRTVSNGSLADRSIPRLSAPSQPDGPPAHRTILTSPSLPSRTSAQHPSPLTTRTVSNPTLGNRTLPRSIVGGNGTGRGVALAAPNNKKESSRRQGSGARRDVSIGYRKEGRRDSTRRKDDGPALVDGKQQQDDSAPWANDSSSEYFDSINESGSLLLDSAEPSHWLAMQREAMAECDSLELRESNQWGQSH